jgi:hypothetical protein
MINIPCFLSAPLKACDFHANRQKFFALCVTFFKKMSSPARDKSAVGSALTLPLFYLLSASHSSLVME